MSESIEQLIDQVKKGSYVISKPIDMFSIETITDIAKLSKDNDILITISYESNSMYSKTMINLVSKSIIESSENLLKIL